jgi:hypothetical protein
MRVVISVGDVTYGEAYPHASAKSVFLEYLTVGLRSLKLSSAYFVALVKEGLLLHCPRYNGI